MGFANRDDFVKAYKTLVASQGDNAFTALYNSGRIPAPGALAQFSSRNGTTISVRHAQKILKWANKTVRCKHRFSKYLQYGPNVARAGQRCSAKGPWNMYHGKCPECRGCI